MSHIRSSVRDAFECYETEEEWISGRRARSMDGRDLLRYFLAPSQPLLRDEYAAANPNAIRFSNVTLLEACFVPMRSSR